MDALAQQAPANPDPLSPKLQTDPRNPPRLQPFNQPPLAQLNAPPTFVPPAPASGAGDSGFDSTNNRKVKAAKAKANPKAPKSTTQPIAPGTAAPANVSPFQKQAAGNGAYAQAPGTPPVELGPIRKLPKKLKAHEEPADPYAALGVHAGAFTLFPAIELIPGTQRTARAPRSTPLRRN